MHRKVRRPVQCHSTVVNPHFLVDSKAPDPLQGACTASMCPTFQEGTFYCQAQALQRTLLKR